jgi:hypothetical protein
MTLTELEKQVIDALLRGGDTTMGILRQQAEHAEVSSREMTGVGFFTEFVVPALLPRVPGLPSFRLGHVNGTAANVKHGLGFVLFVKDGTLQMLEGYTYDEPWPKTIDGLVLTSPSSQEWRLRGECPSISAKALPRVHMPCVARATDGFGQG